MAIDWVGVAIHVQSNARMDGSGIKRMGAECEVSLPLAMGDEFIAALVVARMTRSPFSPDEVPVLEDVARPVTTTVANALHFEGWGI